MGLLLLLVVIWLMAMYFKWVKKSARKSQAKKAQQSETAGVPRQESDPISPILPMPEILPENGKYPKDYLKELDEAQAIRNVQNARYKIAVIDFETTGLNPEKDEILQVSIIDEEENVLINQLCKPVHTETWESAWNVNSIYPGDVRFCPVFAQVAPYVQDILSRADMVIAYNYPFEPNFLRFHGIDPDELTWGPDPMREMLKYYNAAKNTSKKRMSLQWAADIIGYEYNAHDAAEDVKATLHVYNFTQEHRSETQERLQIQAEKEAERNARKGKIQYPENKNADPRHPLYGKTIVITGQLPIGRDEASKKAANLGAKVRLQISPRTQILVCGQREDEWEERYGTKSYKIKKAEQMNAEGANIELMSGQRFMELLDRPAGQI